MVIYGPADVREEQYQIPAARQLLCNSIGILVNQDAVTMAADRQTYTLSVDTLGNELAARYTPPNAPAPMPINQPSIRFWNQDVINSTESCSTAFLIAPDLIATAGHSAWITSGNKVKDFKKLVYRCSDVMIVTRPGKFGGPGQPDLAIIRLETVATQPPLVISTNPPAQDEPLWMAGHGDGLPLKISAGQCSRRDIRALPKPNVQTFYHNLSSFHGNSGSPIFNNNNQVVGIEVWGPDDYDIGTGTITGLFEAAMPAHLSKWGVGMRTDHMRWLIDTAATVTVMAWLPSDAKSSETLDCQITVSYDKTTIGDTNDAQPGKYMLFDVSQDLRKRAVRAIDLDSLLFKLNRIGTETRGVSRRLEYFVIKAANPNNDSQRFCMVYDPTPALMELSAGKKGNVRVDFPEEMLPSLIHDHE